MHHARPIYSSAARADGIKREALTHIYAPSPAVPATQLQPSQNSENSIKKKNMSVCMHREERANAYSFGQQASGRERAMPRANERR